MCGINRKFPGYAQRIADNEAVGGVQDQILNLRRGGWEKMTIDQQRTVVVGNAVHIHLNPPAGKCLDRAPPTGNNGGNQIGDGQKAIGHTQTDVGKRHIDRGAHIALELVGAFQLHVIRARNSGVIQLQSAAGRNVYALGQIRYGSSKYAAINFISPDTGRHQFRVQI